MLSDSVCSVCVVCAVSACVYVYLCTLCEMRIRFDLIWHVGRLVCIMFLEDAAQ